MKNKAAQSLGPVKIKPPPIYTYPNPISNPMGYPAWLWYLKRRLNEK